MLQTFLLKFGVIICFMSNWGNFIHGQEDQYQYLSENFLADNKTEIRSLLRNPTIIKELAISDDQQLNIRALENEVANEFLDRKSVTFTQKQIQEMGEEAWASKRAELGQAFRKFQEAQRKKYHIKFMDILLPKQKERLNQLVVQAYLNVGELFGEYENGAIDRYIKLTTEEKNLLRKKVIELRKQYIAEANRLHAEYHQKIRKSLDKDSQEKIEKIFGPPIELGPENFYITSRRR